MDIYNNPCTHAVFEDAISSGVTSFTELSDVELDKLSAICIEKMGSDAYEIMCSDHAVYHLTCYLRSGDKDHALDLAESLAKVSHDYFEDGLKKSFNDYYENRSYEKQCDAYLAAGKKAHIDFVNGEIVWY